MTIVALRNLTEFNWNLGKLEYENKLNFTHSEFQESCHRNDDIFVLADHLYVIFPYLLAVLSSEYFVDWIKHAFITKFNNIPVEVKIFS